MEVHVSLATLIVDHVMVNNALRAPTLSMLSIVKDNVSILVRMGILGPLFQMDSVLGVLPYALLAPEK